MDRRIARKQSRWSRPTLVVLLGLIALIAAGPAVALGGWGGHELQPFKTFKNDRESSTNNGTSTPAYADWRKVVEKPDIPLSATASTKLFWMDCGTNRNAKQLSACWGSLWFVDPLDPSSTPVLFDDGVFVPNDTDGLAELNSLLSGQVNPDYSVTDLRLGHFFYLKNGRIYVVDTRTLAYKQLSWLNNLTPFPSSDGSPTPGLLCQVSPFVNWLDSSSSIISLHVAGPDSTCWTPDDNIAVVSLGMTAADRPFYLPVNILGILLDGRYVVQHFGTSPWQVAVCDSSAMECTKITEFSSSVELEAYDRNFIILKVDNKLYRYDLNLTTAAQIYTQGANEIIRSVSLDKDGSVFFLTLGTKPLPTTGYFVNYVKKVSPAGTLTRLTSFATQISLGSPPYDQGPDLELTADRAVFTYPNRSYSALVIRSVAKTGGKTTLISNSTIQGGVVGGWYFLENTAGQVQRINLDGSGRLTKMDAQLSGPGFGGAMDWHYGFDPSTMRISVTDGERSVLAYGAAEDFTDPGAGLLLGKVPANLSNLSAIGSELALLGTAQKRNTWFSYGSDVLLLNADPASPGLHRLTNSNGWRLLAESHHWRLSNDH